MLYQVVIVHGHICLYYTPNTPITFVSIMEATTKVNGDLIFQLISWVEMMRSKGNRMMVLGAPFEADTQLVQLQHQKLVDVILTQDGDCILLGATLVQFGTSYACSCVYANACNTSHM